MTKTKTNLDPWEKREHETSKAYAAFCAYRDMGTDRSIAKATPIIYKGIQAEKIRLKYGQLTAWSSKYGWVARVDAYDVYLEENVRRESEAAIKKMAHDHALVASLAIHKGAERIQLIVNGADKDGNPLPSELTPKEAIDFIRFGAELERKSRGAPDQIVELGGEVKGSSVVIYLPDNKREESTTDDTQTETETD